MSQNIFGCDLSKARIDIHARASGHDTQIANEAGAIAAWLADLPVDARIGFEATSGCDKMLIAALAAAGRPIHRINPKRVRDHARGIGVLAKTDRVDARVLADLGQRDDLPVMVPPEADRERLAGILKRRQQLVGMLKAEERRLDDADLAEICRELRSMIRLMKRRIDKLEAEIARLADSCTLAEDAARLRTMPGMGPVTSAVLLAHLPELGRLHRRKIASLAGLAPLARDSGNMRGRRTIWGGRRMVRWALYIAALNAVRCVPRFKARYQRMRAAGKAAKTALIAIARQILVTLNAMFRDKTDFKAADS